MFVERAQGLLLLDDLRLDLSHAVAVAMRVALGEKTLELLDAGLALDDLRFQVRHFTVGETAFGSGRLLGPGTPLRLPGRAGLGWSSAICSSGAGVDEPFVRLVVSLDRADPIRFHREQVIGALPAEFSLVFQNLACLP